ncbi:SURF1 family protein [Caulobacter sp. KR2-114]|uniref:SURF1 family protein n=1 Tax=Caulobacter sp. KR2-114 TaxID=3400912 RepID=UPI003BFB4EA1
MTSETPAASRRFPIGLTIAAAVGVAILLGLGVWQLQRLKWKEGILAHVAALKTAAPQPLDAVLARAAKGENVEFQRVSADCLPFQFPQSRVFLYAIEGTDIHWRPISPCAIDDPGYGMIAIDRGVLAGAVGMTPPNQAVPDVRQVVGVLRNVDAPNFTQKDLKETAASGYQSRDHALKALTAATRLPAPRLMLVVEREYPAPAGITAAPLPIDIPNRHLEYALTWFGLAAALAGVYAALLFRKGGVK